MRLKAVVVVDVTIAAAAAAHGYVKGVVIQVDEEDEEL